MDMHDLVDLVTYRHSMKIQENWYNENFTSDVNCQLLEQVKDEVAFKAYHHYRQDIV